MDIKALFSSFMALFVKHDLKIQYVDDNEERIPFAIVPDNHHIENLHNYVYTGHRICDEVIHNDVDSFIEYWQEHSGERSTLRFCKREENIMAMFDDDIGGMPGCKDHTSLVVFYKTKDAKVWEESNEEQMTHTQFVEFFEDNMESLVGEDSEKFVDKLKSFSLKRQVNFNQAVNLDNGDIKLGYTEEATGESGNVAFPSHFIIAIKPFEGSEPYKVDGKIQFNMRDGKLTLRYKLRRIDKVYEAAFDDFVRIVKERCSGAVRCYNTV